MKKRGCVSTVGMILGGIVLFGACGAILDGTDTAVREATRTPKPTIASTATIMPSATIAPSATVVPVKCDVSEWRAMAKDVYVTWGSVRNIVELDALIARYDSIALPECDGMNDLLLSFDENMRMGMANQRTAMMVDQADAKKYVSQALIAYMQAEQLLKELEDAK